MNEIATIHASGIKCDAPGCGWENMDIPRAAYPHWRNTACPRCGANVLTDADWDALVRLERIAAFLNRWFGWLGRVLPSAKPTLHRITADGTGKLTITKMDIHQ